MLENPDIFGKRKLLWNNKPALGLNSIGFSLLSGWDDYSEDKE